MKIPMIQAPSRWTLYGPEKQDFLMPQSLSHKEGPVDLFQFISNNMRNAKKKIAIIQFPTSQN